MQTGSKTWPFPRCSWPGGGRRTRRQAEDPKRRSKSVSCGERVLGLLTKPAYEGAQPVGFQVVCPSLHNRASQEQSPNHEENQSAGRVGASPRGTPRRSREPSDRAAQLRQTSSNTATEETAGQEEAEAASTPPSLHRKIEAGPNAKSSAKIRARTDTQDLAMVLCLCAALASACSRKCC